MSFPPYVDSVLHMEEIDKHWVIAARHRNHESPEPIYLKPDSFPLEPCPGKHRLLDFPTGRRVTRHHYFVVCPQEDLDTTLDRIRRTVARVERMAMRNVNVSALRGYLAEMLAEAEDSLPW